MSWFGWGEDGDKKNQAVDRQQKEQDIRKLLEAEEDEDETSREATQAILKAMFKPEEIGRVREKVKQEKLSLLTSIGGEAAEGENDAEIKRLIESGMSLKMVEQIYVKADVQRVNNGLNPTAGQEEEGIEIEIEDKDPPTESAQASPSAAVEEVHQPEPLTDDETDCSEENARSMTQQQLQLQLQPDNFTADDRINAGLPPDIARGNACEVTEHDTLYGPRDPPEPPPPGEDPKKRDKDRKKFIPKAERLKTLEATVDEQDFQLQKTLVEMEVMNCERRALERQMQLQDEDLMEILEALEEDRKYTPSSAPVTDSLRHTKDLLIEDLKQQLKYALSGKENAIATSASVGKDGTIRGGGADGADANKIAELEQELGAAKDAHFKEKEALLEKINGLKVSTVSYKSQLKERSKQLDTLRGEAGPEMERLVKFEQEANDARNDLETRLISSEVEAEELRQTVSELEVENSSLHQDKEDLQHTNAELEEKIAGLESSRDELQTADGTASAVLQEVRDELSPVDTDRGQELEISKGALREANDKLTALKSENTELQTSKQTAATKLQETNTKYGNLEVLLDNLQNAKTFLEEELNESNAKVNALEADNSDLKSTQTSISGTNERLASLESDISNLQTSKASLEERLQEASEKYTVLEASGNQELQAAQNCLVEAEEKLATFKSQMSELKASFESDLSDLQSSKASLEQQLHSAEEEIAALETNSGEELQAARSSIVEATDKVARLQADLSELDETKTALEEANEDVIVNLKAAKDSAEEQLQEAQDMLSARIGVLESELGEARLAQKEALDEKETLEEILEEADAAAERQREARTKLEEALKSLNEGNTMLEEELSALKDSTARSEGQLKEAVLSLEADLDGAQLEHQDALNVQASLESELEEAEELSSSLQESLAQREEDVQASLEEKQDVARELFDLHASTHEKELKLVQASEMISALETAMQQSQAERLVIVEANGKLEASLKERISALETENTSLGEHKSLADEQLAQLKDSSADLVGQINEAHARIAELEDDLASDKEERIKIIKAKETFAATARDLEEAGKFQEEHRASLTVELAQFKEFLQQHYSQMTEANEKAEALEVELEQLTIDNAESIKVGEELESLMAEKVKAIENLQSRANELEASKEAAQHEKEDLEAEVSELKLAVSDVEMAFTTSQEKQASLEEKQILSKKEAEEANEAKENIEANVRDSASTIETLQLEMYNLEQASKTLQEEKHAIEQEVSTLKGSLTGIQAERLALEEEVRQAKIESEATKKAMEILVEAKLALESERGTLEAERNSVVQEMTQLIASLDEKEAAIGDTKEKLSSLEEELAQAKIDSEAIGEAMEKVEEAKGILEEEKGTLEGERLAFVQELSSLEEALSQAKKQAEEASEAKGNLEVHLRDSESTKETLQMQLSMVEGTNKSLQGEKDVIDQHMSQLKTSLEEKDESLAESSGKFAKLQTDLDQVLGEMQALVVAKEALEVALDEAEAGTDEVQRSLTLEKDTLNEDHVMLEASLEAAQEQLEVANESITSLEEQLESAQEEKENTEEVKDALEANLRDSGSMTESLQLRISALEQANNTRADDNALLQKELSSAVSSKKALDRQLEEIRTQFARLESDKETLTTEMAYLEGEVKETHAQLHEAEERETVHTQLLQQANTTHSALRETNNMYVQEKEALSVTVAELGQGIKRTGAVAIEDTKRIHALEDELDQVQAENQSLSEQNASLDTIIDEMSEQLQSAEEDLDFAQNEERELTAGITQENVILRKAVSDAKQLITGSNDKILNLLEDRESLQFSVQQSDATINQLQVDLMKVQTEHSSLSNQLNEASDEKETFASRSIGKDNEHLEELKSVKSERDELKERVDKQEREIETSQAILETLRSDVADLEARALGALEEKRAFKKHLDDFQESVSKKNKAFEAEASESMRSLVSEKEVLAADLERIKTEDSEEKIFLQEILNDSKATIDSLQEGLLKARSENNVLVASLEQMDEELQAVLAEKETMQSSLEQAKADHHKESEHKEYLKTERSALVNQIAELEETLKTTVDSSNVDLDEEDDLNHSSERDLLVHVAARLKMTEPDGTVRSVYGSSSDEDEDEDENKRQPRDKNMVKEDSKEEVLEENEVLRETVADLENQIVTVEIQLDVLMRRFSPVHGRIEEADDGDNGLMAKLSKLERATEDYKATLKETSERLEAIVSEKITLERHMESVAESLKRSLVKESSIEQMLDAANEKIANLMDQSCHDMDDSQNRLADFQMEKKMITARMAELKDDIEKKKYEPENAFTSEDFLAKELHRASQRLQELDALIQREVFGGTTTAAAGTPDALRMNDSVENHFRAEIQALKDTIAEKEQRIQELSTSLDAAVSETYSIEAAADQTRRQHEELLATSRSLSMKNAPPSDTRYLSAGGQDSDSLKSRVNELEGLLEDSKEQATAVQERLDTVLMDQCALERQVDRLSEEKQKSIEAQTRLEASLKTSESSIEVYSNAVGELEVVLQSVDPNIQQESSVTQGEAATSPEYLMKRIHALSDIISSMQTSDDELAETEQQLRDMQSEKEELEAAMDRSAQKSAKLMDEAGKKLLSMEDSLRETETQRDQVYERASTLQQVVMKLEDDKENEIHLLNIVMEQLRELDIEMPWDEKM